MSISGRVIVGLPGARLRGEVVDNIWACSRARGADGIPVFERDFSLVETYGAEEAFLTGSFGGHTPVRMIDGRPIGEGGAGPVTTRIRELYRALVRGHAD